MVRKILTTVVVLFLFVGLKAQVFNLRAESYLYGNYHTESEWRDSNRSAKWDIKKGIFTVVSKDSSVIRYKITEIDEKGRVMVLHGEGTDSNNSPVKIRFIFVEGGESIGVSIFYEFFYLSYIFKPI